MIIKKIERLLMEERINNKDKRILMKLIGGTPKKTTFVLDSFKKDYTDDERKINVTPISKGIYQGITLEFNSDHFELLNTLIDIADDSGFAIESATEKQTNTTYAVITWKN